MAGISDYLENKILDHMLRNQAFTPPTTVYLALFTSDPGDDASGTEVSGGSYAREAITFGSAASGGQISNTADITFTTATASWGTVTHVGIFDAATVGNLLWHGALSASKTVGDGDTFKVNTGDLDVSVT